MHCESTDAIALVVIPVDSGEVDTSGPGGKIGLWQTMLSIVFDIPGILDLEFSRFADSIISMDKTSSGQKMHSIS